MKKKSLTDEEIKQEIEKTNKKLSKIENIKKYFTINEKFSIENGMLTPTLKLKRFKIIQKYKNLFRKTLLNLFLKNSLLIAIYLTFLSI